MRKLFYTLPLALLAACGDADKTPQAVPPAQPTELVATEGFSGKNAYVHCAALCAMGPRPTGSAAYEQQVAYLTKHLEHAGWRVQVQRFSPSPQRPMQNVHATFGKSEGVRPLLISCHIDTKGQGKDAILGADDGASGAAALLELARALALSPALAEGVELVFFDGEESFGKHMSDTDGLFGSKYDVKRRGDALPRRMINLDMVGGAGKVIGVPIFDTSEKMCEHYLKAVRALGYSEDRWTLYPGSYLDDPLPFMEAGVETLNLIALFRGANWWHTAKDDMSRISAESLHESGCLVMQLIRQMADEMSSN